jgi:hypothetical protein
LIRDTVLPVVAIDATAGDVSGYHYRSLKFREFRGSRNRGEQGKCKISEPDGVEIAGVIFFRLATVYDALLLEVL